MDEIEPKIGEWLRGIYASESNPRRDGMYVRTIIRRGRMNPGKFYELTDGNGNFWVYLAQFVERIAAALAEPKAGAVRGGWGSKVLRDVAERAERLASNLARLDGAALLVGEAEGIAALARRHGWVDPRPHAAPQAKPCPCGEATCVEPWEPGCGLGTSAEHAVVATAAPHAKPGEPLYCECGCGREVCRSCGNEILDACPNRPALPAEQQGQAVAWQSESMSALAQQLRSRGDDVSLDAATWLERFAKPQPAAVDAVRVDDAMVERGAAALNEALGGGCLCEAMRTDVRAVLEAALPAQGREGEVGRG